MHRSFSKFTALVRRLAKPMVKSTYQKGEAMGIGVAELLVIILIVLVIFGSNRLPALGRGIGRSIKNFREAAREREKGQD
jgi:sec-independent protein translocase protein TatA|tara:strand:- start:2145 stop:2384 length:240 start_codon:yes stop_codon:yes gene_type:complete